MNPEPEYEILTPAWPATAQMLVEIINNADNHEAKQWAESEVLRMGRIIEQQTERTDELEKAKERQDLVLERRNQKIVELGDKLFDMEIDLGMKDYEFQSLKNYVEVQEEDMKKLRDKNLNLKKKNRQAGDRIIELQHKIDEDKR